MIATKLTKIVSLFIFIVTSLSVSATSIVINNVEYQLDEAAKTAILTGINAKISDLVIPEVVQYDGEDYVVTTIGGKKGVIPSVQHAGYLSGSLTIPNSVTRIEDYAFEQCSNLNGTLTLGENIQYIGKSAFSECGFSGELKLPDSLETIGKTAFFLCKNFEGDLVIPDKVSLLEGYTFHACSGFNGNLRIGSGMKEIEYEAFNLCSGFTSLEIIGSPDLTIGHSAFYSLKNCKSIYLSSNVKYIGSLCFSNFESLETIVCEAINPPTVILGGGGSSTLNYAFSGLSTSNLSEIKLYVPKESIELYGTAYDWKRFINVNAIVETESIALSPFTLDMIVGEKAEITTIIKPDDATVKLVHWESSDPTVASISDEIVSALNSGSAIITATTTNGTKATCEVSVKEISAIDNIYTDSSEQEVFDVYNLQGICIKHKASKSDIDSLPSGIYIIGGKAIFVR